MLIFCTVLTQDVSNMPATENVFCTAELLEAILLHASMRDILQAERVAHQWQDVIQGSAKLQQMLFLAPTSVKAVRLIEAPPKKPYQYLASGLVFDFEFDFTTLNWKTDEADRENRVVSENPLLSRILEVRHDGLDLVFDLEHKLHKLVNKDGSWNRMQLTSPPVSEIELSIIPTDGRAYNRRTPTIHAEAHIGVTIGELVRAVTYHAGGCREALVSIRGGDQWNRDGK